MTKMTKCSTNLIQISCYTTLHSPPNMWQSLIRGHVQMKTRSDNEKVAGKS